MRRSVYTTVALRRLVVGLPVALLGLLLVAAPAAFAALRPVIGRELTSEVGTTEVKLGALVNPEGTPANYRFEYGPTTAYGDSTPFPAGSVGEGATARAVWAAASGLAPGSVYHYRVAVTNERGTVYGPDQTFTTLTAAQASCPNDEFRGGFSAHLPDCRAYELVTPTTKTSVQIEGAGQAAASGDAIEFSTKEPEPGTPTGSNFYIARRGAAGWSPEAIMPLEDYTGTVCSSYSNGVLALSSELDRAAIFWGYDSRAGEPGGSGTEEQECNAEGLQVAPGEPVGYQNLLLRESATGAFTLVNAPETGLTGVTPADAFFKGASADLRHLLFTEPEPLTENAPHGVEDLYEWEAGGGVRLVTVLPDKTATTGSLARAPNGRPAISADGSDVLFTSGGSLYARIDGRSTVQVDKSQTGGTSGGGQFQDVSADGQTIFFTDEGKLTTGSTAESGEPDLYECALPAGASECQLTDLTPEASVAKAGEHADVLGVSSLGSADSSHVYFTARGVLAEKAQSGEKNLYLDRAGAISYIATLAENDFGVGDASPDGSWFAFDSSKSLTGYDNTPAAGFATPVDEIFLYDAASGGLVCASCQPSGEAPIAGDGASLAGGRRELSDGGRLFFQTFEALVPSDTNGQLDVYEYEAESGQARLISDGTGASESKFEEASERGDDVFFQTRQQLLPQDTEPEAQEIYDARVDGGFPFVTSPQACTTPEGCRGAASPQPTLFGAPASQTFSGLGNLTPGKPAAKKARTKRKAKCRRGSVRQKRRCGKAKREKKIAKRHKRAAESNHNSGRR